jgi:bacteriocin biosynthesis cyclodehydratase domain-containing protein
MLTRPELKSCYRIEALDENHVLLLAERQNHQLSGAAFGALVPLLDGSRDVAEIVSAAGKRVSAAEIYYSLQRLEELGVVREGCGVPPGPATAFWDSLGADVEVASRSARQAKVELSAIHGVSTHPLASALAALGVAIAEEADLLIVLVDDYLQPALAGINKQQLRDKKPWLLAKTVGTTVWIGPFLIPGATGCWECLAQRLRGNRHIESYIELRKGGSRPLSVSLSALPSTELTAAGLLATEVVKWLAQAPGCLEGVLVTWDLIDLTSHRHSLVRRPQCPTCGEGEAWTKRAPRPVRLESRGKSFTTDGGHRGASPVEILKRYEHHVSPLLGVVRELRRASHVDHRVAPVYTADHNRAREGGDTLRFFHANFRAVSGGKGKTDAQARASAFCEAVERYSADFQGDEVRLRGSYRALGDAAIHPNACMGFSAAQYAGRDEWNAAHGQVFQWIPLPFDEQCEIEWTPLWSLSESRFKYLPTAYCYFNYPLPLERRFCRSDSNGNAAGGSLEEAILQGFMELVERDSVALWWYNRVTRPGVDLDSFEEPYFREWSLYCRSLQRESWVLDITADFGIPSFAAVTRRTDGPPEDITLGFGAHSDARIGILRALTEANQFLPIVLPRHANPSAPYPLCEEAVLNWLRTSTLSGCPFLAPAPGALRRAEDYTLRQYDDFKDEVEACVALAAERGLETLVLDQTRPDIGLPVVKVVVPGLRHFWARFGPGRLYDVPVALGWQPVRSTEAELNPVPVFF